MCGFVGVVDYQKQLSLPILQQMTDTMRLRGPDDAGYRLFESPMALIGLGHRRLSIFDLSPNGHQPMQFQDWVIVFNGEVYNFKDIRVQLVALGHVFQSDSDTEVILKAYHQWGERCVEQFRGMFAFALYHQSQHKLILYRDRLGVKPLYYVWAPEAGLFLFGSTPAALVRHPRFQKQIDSTGLALYLQYGYIRAPYSIYQGMKKLRPGHCLEVCLASHTLTLKAYWDLSQVYAQAQPLAAEAPPYEQAVNELEAILMESFQLRLHADVPVGLFLSGGIDSALVTALLQANRTQKLKTFTIGFKGHVYDEAAHARAIAQHLHTDHTEFYCTEQDAQVALQALPALYDEPLGDTSALAMYLIAQVAREQVTVALSGDGGDEFFCGYTAYIHNYQRLQRIQGIPFAARRFAYRGLNALDPLVSPFLGHHSPLGTRYHRLLNLLDLNDLAQMHQVTHAVFTAADLKQLLQTYQRDIPTPVAESSIETLKRIMVTDAAGGYLADDILVKVDKATMGVSLENREPLLDHQIIEYSARLPLAYLQQKRILKSILARYVPATLYERPKQGFGVPVNTWLRTDFQYLLEEYLSPAAVEQTGLLHYPPIARLKQDFKRGISNDSKLWVLLAFQMWYRQVFLKD